MGINFDFKCVEDGHCLTVKTDTGDDIDVFFRNGKEYAQHIYVDDTAFVTHDDQVHGFFVKIGGEFYSLADVVREADLASPAIIEEINHETREYRDMERHLSCPRRTGRI